MASSALPIVPLWMQNGEYPADVDRKIIGSIFDGEGTVEGLVVSPAGGLDISISPGSCLVEGDEVANQGLYLVASESTVTLTVASVGVDRTEYVYVAINDSSVIGGRAGDNVTIETAAALPADSTYLIATITLTAGQVSIISGNITDERVSTKILVPTETIIPASVGTDELADSSVVTAKLANLGTTSAKLATSAVTETKIGPSAVVESKIADNAVTPAKVSFNAHQIAEVTRFSFAGSLVVGAFDTENITWSTEVSDPDGMGSTGSDTLTIQVAGVYSVSLHSFTDLEFLQYSLRTTTPGVPIGGGQNSTLFLPAGATIKAEVFKAGSGSSTVTAATITLVRLA